MPERSQKLTTEAVAKGFDKAAKEHDKVAGAQQKVAGQTKEGAKAATDAADAQGKLNASESDFVGLLSQVSPELGRFADAMVKGVKISGDLATSNIELGKVLEMGKAAAVKYAGALKLLVAGGAVVAGILAIAAAIRKVKEEHEAATRAVNEQIEAETELANKQRDAQQTLENLAATRREGGFTAEQARTAAQQAQRVKQRFGFLDEGAIQQAAALGGLDRSDEELARVALLFQSGRGGVTPETPAVARRRIIGQRLGRHAAMLDREFGREGVQQAELNQAAFQQISGQVGGSLDAVAQIVGRHTEGEGIDAMRVAKALQFYADARKAAEWGIGPQDPDVDAGTISAIKYSMERAGAGFDEGDPFLSPGELQAAKRTHQIIINNYIQPRVYSEGAKGQQERMLHGRNVAGHAEEVR